jgi:hypothetical protein
MEAEINAYSYMKNMVKISLKKYLLIFLLFFKALIILQ